MRIANIQPTPIWSEGTTKNVNKLGVMISEDDLVSRATFKYTLLKDEVALIVSFIDILIFLFF